MVKKKKQISDAQKAKLSIQSKDRKWYNNGKQEILLKPWQEIPDGFIYGRLPKKDTKLIQLSEKFNKEYIYDLYIIQNLPFDKLFEKLSITRKDLRRLLTLYNISKPKTQIPHTNTRSHESYVEAGKKSGQTQKKHWEEKSEKEKQAYRDLQKQAHSTESFKAKIKQANIDYQKSIKGTEKYFNLNAQRSATLKAHWSDNNFKEAQLANRNDLQCKAREKRKQEGLQFCRSVAEQKLYNAIVQQYPDVLYDVYGGERYPFYCDFYIPSEDIFIELNAHPSHGRLPIEYLNIEEYSKYNTKYVDVFARRDKIKNQTAIDNNLNYIRIYPQATLEENLQINSDRFEKIVNICYNSQKHKL